MNYIKRHLIPIPVRRERVIERIVEKPTEDTQQSQPIDINALANAIAQAMRTMPISQTLNNSIDSFDNSKTLEKLAETMTVQRGNNTPNFDNLGNEQHTKTDKDEIAKTIDLLKDLSD